MLPLWIVANPPLVDYPNHLARMHILMLNGADATLNNFYQIDWQVLPNLAMDLIVPALGRVVGLELAGKVFLSATLLGMFTGTIALHYAVHRRWSTWPLVAGFFVYNSFLLFGFLNYIFGVGAAFWLAALWLLHRERGVAWYFFPPMALGLFFSHLMSFGIYLAIIGAYELAQIDGRQSWRSVTLRAAQVALQVVPAVTLLFLASPTGEGESGPLFAEIARKVTGFRYIFTNYSPLLDFKGTAIPLSLALFFGLATGGIKIARRMYLPLAAMLLLYFMMPHILMTSVGAWRRFSLPIAMLFIASTDWYVTNKRLNTVVAALACVLFFARLGVVGAEWKKQDAEIASIRKMFRSIPDGSRVQVLYLTRDSSESPWTYRSHLPLWSIIDRHVFVPTLFAHATQQPVRLSVQAEDVVRHGRGGSDFPLAAVAGYDYLVVTNVQYLSVEMPAAFERMAMVHDVALYRVGAR
jgi:uncharacterized membrane protein